ncbi:MAG: SDR family oxidoreductase [Candidatus Paceibacterota bacterium]
MDLKNKVVVITGSTSGLGLELAKLFKKDGAKVVVNGKSEESLEEIPSGASDLSIPADVSKEEEVKNLASKVMFELGRIDIWINNAGIWLPHGGVNDLNMEKVRAVFDVNVFGLMHGSRAALSFMKKQNSGIILNIISVSALEIHLDSAAYAASKFAADGFTKGLRLEVETYEGSGIKILSCYPPGMKTRLFDEARPENFDEYLEPREVAEKIIANLKLENPEVEQKFLN